MKTSNWTTSNWRPQTGDSNLATSNGRPQTDDSNWRLPTGDFEPATSNRRLQHSDFKWRLERDISPPPCMLCVDCVFTVCSLWVHCVLPGCLQCVHCVFSAFTECSLSGHWTFTVVITVCPLRVLRVFKMYSLCSREYSRRVHYVSILDLGSGIPKRSNSTVLDQFCLNFRFGPVLFKFPPWPKAM
jgi:hypothetical protein